MYSENEEKRGIAGYLFKDFIVKLILIIIFILLFIWLFPMPKMQDISPLTSRIFNDNISEMKEAATSYFTNERLPQIIGDKKKITLYEMLEKHLLVAFVDKKGETCDVHNSYVEITKEENEYLMKVYLKCSSETDYILVHMGCYDYCDKDICEKEETPVITTPTVNPKPVTPTPKPTPNPTCNITCGANQTLINGNSPDCYCQDNYVPPVEETCPITSCGKNEILINGNSKDCYCQKVETPKEKEYEYKLNVAKQYSNWGPWSADIRYVNADINSGKVKFEKNEYTWTEHSKTVQERVGWNYDYDYNKPIYNISYDLYLGTTTQKVCTDYDYYLIYDTKTKTTTKYVTTKGGSATAETYAGLVSSPVSLEDKNSPTVRYEFVDYDWSGCNDCTSGPNMIYKKYVRSYTGTVTSSTTTTDTIKTVSGVDVRCSNYETRSVKRYGINKTFVDFEKVVTGPKYANVKYYHTRTRTLLKDAYTDYKWSKYNDTTLLNKGYTYTGKERTK